MVERLGGWSMAVALLAGCGGAPAPQPVSAEPAASSATPASRPPVLPLADFAIYTSAGVIDVRADGGFFENGTRVGTFTPDGRLLNVDGNEIGRLTPGGRIYFAGRLDEAAIDSSGTRLASPSRLIATFDASGNLVVNGVAFETRGYAPALGRSILFAFAMYSALLYVAQHMDEGAPPAQPAPQEVTPMSGQAL